MHLVRHALAMKLGDPLYQATRGLVEARKEGLDCLHALGNVAQVAAAVRQSELCADLKVNYIAMPADLVSRQHVPEKRPKAIERFLEIMDDPANHPVLVHCKAGLHRTGCLIAVYRMEYDGWTSGMAMDELKECGFGETAATSANEYIKQYILTYRPRESRPAIALGGRP